LDLLVGWLEGSHGKYLDPYREKAVLLATIYEPYCIWGVPDYVPASSVNSVLDLRNPDVEKIMKKKIQGINAGAGISRFSLEMIQKYDLGTLGYSFHNGTQEECFSTFENAVSASDWIVVPLWHPQFLHYKYNIRALEDPLKLLRGKDKATIILHSDSLRKFDSTAINILKRIYLGNTAVSMLDYYVSRGGRSYKDAACRWMQEHKEIVDSWFNTPQDRLKSLGITIPSAPHGVANYEGWIKTKTDIVMTSLQLPWINEKLAYSGRCGDNLGKEEGYHCARICALNAISQLSEAAEGDLSRIRILRVDGCVQCTLEFKDTPYVLNGASDLFKQVFGVFGTHTRTALQHLSTPLNSPVLIAVWAELR